MAGQPRPCVCYSHLTNPSPTTTFQQCDFYEQLQCIIEISGMQGKRNFLRVLFDPKTSMNSAQYPPKLKLS
jgi:hypothetical protein